MEHKRASTFVARAGALPINGSDAEAIPSLSPFPFLLFYDASWAHEPPGMVSARPQKDVTQQQNCKFWLNWNKPTQVTMGY